MADKTISELVAATSVGSSDLFVLEQAGAAKKLTGQILENWLVSFADGHGGIQSIVKTSSTGTNPVVDTYTITLADETEITFEVTNGVKGDTGAQTYVWIKWAAQEPTADNQMSGTPDAWIGIYTGLSSTAPTHYTDYSWYEYKGDKGDTGDSIGSVVWTSNSAGAAQGTAGTTDTYTVYSETSENLGTVVVYNGNDGEGAPGSATPLPDGTASAGSANAYSREDHVHPLNVPTSGTPQPLGPPANGSAGTYARSDHVHPLPTATDLLNLVYPVGSIYMSVSSTSPASLFGGTWTQIQDKFLLAAGTTYAAGSTGGEAAHTLTDSELPVESGSFSSRAWSGSGSLFFDESGIVSRERGEGSYNNVPDGQTAVAPWVETISFGGGQSHNNMPPYLAVYVWQRTA